VIPKVNKYELAPEILEDEAAYRARPEWFKFYYAAWLMSTASMDDKQRGWYIQLLTYAATEGDPPGYLPSDDNELKQIAGMSALPSEFSYLLSLGVPIPQTALTQIIAERERAWRKVRRKFVPWSEDEDLCYNPRLVKALKQAYRVKDRTSEMGKAGAESRWGKDRPKKKIMTQAMPYQNPEPENEEAGQVKGKKDLMAEAMATSMPKPMPIKYLSSLNTQEGKMSLESMPPLSLDEETSEEELVLELIDVSENIVSGPAQNPDAPTDSDEGKVRIPGKRRRLPETFFSKDKWSVTAKMISHLLTKYASDGIEQGDIDWLGEKFALVHYNNKYASWSRAFYNFVDNQLTKYGYNFGDYKRRGKRNEQRQRPETTGEADQQPAVNPPWKRIESAPERNARLEQESDEAIRRLRGGSGGVDSEGQKGLSLTADDVG